MSIRINDQVISGKYEPSSYRYVGEIFQSAIPIDDIRVTLLDGHKIYESEGYGSFIQYMHSIIMLYPQLACTEDEWQTINTTYGECGKFVVSENNIRLPKIVSFVQGLSSLQDLATLVEAGLPNIEGTVRALGGYFSGAFSLKSTVTSTYGGTSTSSYETLFKASDSNPIYGNSTTVQPQSIRYPYYIVLATGVTQEVKAKEELMTNIPFTLFESKYSEVELNNASWLLSSGQWNSRELYPSAYNELVRAYSEGSSRLSVKLHISEYSDYDFVLNLNDETFRLPLLNGSEDLLSDKYIDLTLDASGSKYIAPANGWFHLDKVSGDTAGKFISFYNNTKRNGVRSFSANNHGIWITLPVQKGDSIACTYDAIGTTNYFRFIYAQGNGSLYFYVGETVQNTNLINTGKLTQEVAELKNKVHLKESYTNGTSWYRVYSDGWCEQGGQVTGASYNATTNNVTFLKPFLNTNYCATATPITGEHYCDSAWVQYKTTTAMTVKTGWQGSTATNTLSNWEAKGYIA